MSPSPSLPSPLPSSLKDTDRSSPVYEPRRQLLRWVAASVAVGLGGQGLSAGAVQPSDMAPEFALSGVGNTAVRLSGLRGQWVYLDFWASWCTPCRLSFPWMNEMHDRYASSGLRVVALNVDKHSSDADAFLRQHPARFLVCFDSTGETPQRYAVKAMPTSLLIDPTGRVVWVHTGFRNEHREELEQKIKTALKGAA